MKNTRLLTTVMMLFASVLIATPLIAGDIDWHRDYEKALAKAKERNTILMIDVYTDWCHWCKELDKKVFTDDSVVDLSNKLVAVKLDAEDNGMGTQVARKFGVQGYPTILFINPEEEEVDRIGGFLPAADFASEMERILSGNGTLKDRMANFEKGSLAAEEYVPLALHHLKQQKIDKGEEILVEFMNKYPDHADNAPAYGYMILIRALANDDEGADMYLKKLKSQFADQSELIKRAETTLTQIRSQR